MNTRTPNEKHPLADLCEYLALKSKEHKTLATLTGYSSTGDAMANHHREWADTLDGWITQIQSLTSPYSAKVDAARPMREHDCAMTRDMRGTCFVCGSSSLPPRV
jgi:hypothetical protein